MIRNIKRFLLPIMLLVCASGAGAIPITMSYQGRLTDSEGQSVPDGIHSLQFGVYPESAGVAPPLWQFGPVPVQTSGGIFTTEIPLNLSVISGNDELWLEVAVNGETLGQRKPLTSVPYAARSAVADTVPDGSITPEKMADGMFGFARAPYLTGIRSGLPPGSALVVKIDNVIVPCRLGAPYTENWDVIEHQIIDPGGNPVIIKIPGNVNWSPLVLQRPLSKNNVWRQWAMSTRESIQKKGVVLEVNGPDNAELSRWEGQDAWVSRYTLRLVDDGLPIEEIALEFDSDKRLLPEHLKSIHTRPSGTSVQTGILTGYPDSYRYFPRIDEFTLRDYLVASDSGFRNDVIIQTVLIGDQVIRKKIPGRLRFDDVKILRGIGSDKMLVDWYIKLTKGNVERKDVDLMMGDQQLETLLKLKNCWPSSYKLMLANDGLPVEEFTIVSEDATFP